jgi:hypothetical protein
MIRGFGNFVSTREGFQTVQVTFIDESGLGIARYSVTGKNGDEYMGGVLECPRNYTTAPFEVPNENLPLSLLAVECAGPGREGEGNAYTSTYIGLNVLPVDPEHNPCTEPSALAEEGDNPCYYGREFVNDIAREIEELCAQLAEWQEDKSYHDTKLTAYTAAAAALLVAATVALLVSTLFGPITKLILQIIAAALFVACLVTASLAGYHEQEKQKAERAIAELETQLNDARNRYRDAVEEAIYACCGHIPSGMNLDPPECSR